MHLPKLRREHWTRAEIRHRELRAALFTRLVRDETRHKITRGLPDVRRGLFAGHAGAHEIISEKLVGAPVVVGQLGKFTRETFDGLHERGAAVRFGPQFK